MNKILDKVNLLRSINFNNISKDQLEAQLPLLGMNNEILREFPEKLYKYCTGSGLRFWQYPNQFSSYLKFLSQLEIDSYLEIGCRWGGTFVIVAEALRQRNLNITLYACDIIEMSEVLKQYSTIQNFYYFEKSSFELQPKDFVNHKADLVFIDGSHSYHAVEKDFNLALSLDAKYIVFHDISSTACPQSTHHWQQLKQRYANQCTFHEFTDQYDSVPNNYLGIGVMQR